MLQRAASNARRHHVVPVPQLKHTNPWGTYSKRPSPLSVPQNAKSVWVDRRLGRSHSCCVLVLSHSLSSCSLQLMTGLGGRRSNVRPGGTFP